MRAPGSPSAASATSRRVPGDGRRQGRIGPGCPWTAGTRDRSNPLLVPFVSAPTDDDARSLLSDVLARDLVPIVRQVVRGHAATRDLDGAADGEDVEHSVLVRLTHQLWRQRGRTDEPIENVAAYVARTASNACYEQLRGRRPQRARLHARLRYVFRHHATLALWERRDGGWACGDRAWRDRDGVLGWPAVAEWRGRIAVPAAGDPGSEAARLVRLVEEIVRTLGAPARLEDVVTLAADALGIVDTPVEPAITQSGEIDHAVCARRDRGRRLRPPTRRSTSSGSSRASGARSAVCPCGSAWRCCSTSRGRRARTCCRSCRRPGSRHGRRLPRCSRWTRTACRRSCPACRTTTTRSPDCCRSRAGR